jgi:hypothetical protein
MAKARGGRARLPERRCCGNAAMENELVSAAPPKRKRRWYQFSLRTLFVITLIVAIPSMLIGRKVEQKRQQLAAVEAIRRLGGYAVFDWEFDDYTGEMHSQPPGPSWLREFLGENYFAEVERVTLNGVNIKDDDLKSLETLTNLEYLDLMNTSITNNGLLHLKGLTRLKVLLICDTQIDDSGTDIIEGLTTLEWLLVGRSKVSDAGLKRLKEALPDCVFHP